MTSERVTMHSIRKIYLMMGNACNFHCPHCVQHDAHPRIKKQVSPDVINWIKTLAASRPESLKPTVLFWGGEPLLYRSVMHSVVDELGDVVDYALVSNGALLTDEDVDWINKHNVYFAYSNDGKNTYKVRDEDMLTNPAFVERFKRINNRNIDSTWHALNANPYELWDYIEDKVGAAGITLEDLLCTTNVPNETAAFDIPALEKVFDNLYTDVMHTFATGEMTRAFMFLKKPITRVAEGVDKSPAPRCGACLSNVSVDLSGKIYLCHNSEEVVGHVCEDFDAVHKRAQKRIKEKMQALVTARDCQNCKAYGYCTGGCPLEDPAYPAEKVCQARTLRWLTAKRCIDSFYGKFK